MNVATSRQDLSERLTGKKATRAKSFYRTLKALSHKLLYGLMI